MNEVNIRIENEVNRFGMTGLEKNSNLVAFLIHHNMLMSRMILVAAQTASMNAVRDKTVKDDKVPLPAVATFDVSRDVPLSEKYSLSVQEAARVFGIGETRLYDIINRYRGENFILEFGGKTRIKRELFAKFLDEVSCI